MAVTAAILAWALAATALAAGGELVPSRDLAAEAREARATGRALVVLFSTAGCPWCERVRAEFLLPMQKNADDAKRILVREIDIDSRQPLTDFAGRRTTHAEFAGALGVRFVPTVAFFAPDGSDAAERLVGFRTADYYGAYLDARVETAREKTGAKR